MENVQRRVTRLVKSLFGQTYSQRLRALGLPSLEYRRERSDMVEVYKISNNIDMTEKDRLFTMATICVGSSFHFDLKVGYGI